MQKTPRTQLLGLLLRTRLLRKPIPWFWWGSPDFISKFLASEPDRTVAWAKFLLFVNVLICVYQFQFLSQQIRNPQLMYRFAQSAGPVSRMCLLVSFVDVGFIL